ncbi:MAG: hypothetical protein ACLQU1_18675 [Bryobacteraceae bacterium]
MAGGIFAERDGPKAASLTVDRVQPPRARRLREIHKDRARIALVCEGSLSEEDLVDIQRGVQGEWQEMKTRLKKDEFAVATDLYYINVSKS